jgi:hypothetical protein
MSGEKRHTSFGDPRKRRNGGLPMGVLLLGLSLGALPCGGQDGGSIAPVALYARFQAEPAPSVMSSVRQGLADIMRPVGIRFEWRSQPNISAGEVEAELAVITFKGNCDLSGMTPLPSKAQVLGVTHAVGGVIIPFSDIDCDAVRNLIQRDLCMERPADRELLYGRAIARVLAHELYHILANTAKHGSCGIGKSAYTSSELLAEDFYFEPRNLNAIQAGTMMANLKNPAQARRSAAGAGGVALETSH